MDRALSLPLISSLASFSLIAMAMHMHSVWQQRQRLAALDDARLDDLGISAKQAHREASRPLWDY
ncbi:uncharacterized protein YjiS (DUF1127 family) [Rubricella aquisinus]|uniref:Uncharacterized protein YjiS (DUF1127 family) n=1 Tax=Rubricella aquisinus TaxID=2028108 RepID=A0A840WWK5_9RHOB|nr:DUF1127 domain-containing protein [Rubricella aquisinus]MBB5515560.1 uncharacterized protein YjiS (DUF1127 family) [Rubricella aquisinus]